MIDSIFDEYDKKKSRDEVQRWLSLYWDWRDEAKRREIHIGSPKIDGLPKGTLPDPDEGLVEWSNAEREWKLRENVLNYMKSKGDEHELYALILDYRFVHHHWEVIKVARELNISKSTCERMQKNALWEASKISGIMVKKQSAK